MSSVLPPVAALAASTRVSFSLQEDSYFGTIAAHRSSDDVAAFRLSPLVLQLQQEPPRHLDDAPFQLGLEKFLWH